MSRLYHCFRRNDRNVSSSLSILESLIANGLYLTKEEPEFRWRDPLGSGEELNVLQYRFCLTSLHTDEDLAQHCKTFGPVGIGFDTDLIRALGGFPVFYLPSPTESNVDESEDYLGVSLVYRLAELRAVLSEIHQLPSRLKRQIHSHVSDIEELEGAVRFLGNILYFTDYSRQDDDVSLRYYKQREWRIIAGLTSDHSKVINDAENSHYVLQSLNGINIADFIEDIIVSGDAKDKKLIDDLLESFDIKLRARLV